MIQNFLEIHRILPWPINLFLHQFRCRAVRYYFGLMSTSSLSEVKPRPVVRSPPLVSLWPRGRVSCFPRPSSGSRRWWDELELDADAWTDCGFLPFRSLLAQLRQLQSLIKQTVSKGAQTSTCLLVGSTRADACPRYLYIVCLVTELKKTKQNNKQNVHWCSADQKSRNKNLFRNKKSKFIELILSQQRF